MTCTKLIKKIAFTAFVVLYFFAANAQNLVPNSSLEQFTPFTGTGSIPTSATYGPNFTHAHAWVNPQNTDPEYYHEGINAPVTWCCGTRNAHSGKGFKGIDTWGFGGGEHVETKLTQPLTAGREYFVSFWLAQSTRYPMSTDNFGAHFSNTYWTGAQLPATQNAVQQGFYPDTSWRMFHSIYTATGGEEFITLGMVPVPWTIIPKQIPGFSGSWGYMFLDDICVYDMSDTNNYTLSDTLVCTNSYPIEINNAYVTGIYYWNTGDTTASISVNADGKYWRRTYLPCSFRVDTFIVGALTPLSDTSICKGDSVNINIGGAANQLIVLSGDTGSISCTSCHSPWLAPHITTTYAIEGICAEYGSDTFTIYVNHYPVISITTEIGKCQKDTIRLNLDIAGINSTDVDIQWNPGNFLSNDAIHNPLCYSWQSITYTVTVKNKSGAACFVSDTVKVNIFQPGFVADTLVCSIDTIQFINQSTSSSGNYFWDFGNGTYSSDENPEHTYDIAGYYTVKLVAPPCIDTFYKIITVDAPSDSLFFSTNKRKICTGEEIFFTSFPDYTTTALYWDLGDGNSLATPNEHTIQHAYGSQGTMYTILTASFRACPDMAFKDSVVVYPPPLVILGQDSIICLNGKSITLANQEPHHKGYRYKWNTGDTALTLKVTHQGIYTLTVINEHDCATTEAIRVDKDCFLDIPNVFTPNSDGVNDYFFPRQLLSRSIEGFHIRIFNRWGQILFETANTNGRGWDGTYNNKNQPEGVYLYLVDILFSNRRKEQYKGNVTLIR